MPGTDSLALLGGTPAVAAPTAEQWQPPVEEEKRAALCLCKRTGSRPLCDGSHREL